MDTQNQPQPAGKSQTIYWVILIVVILAVAGGAYYFFKSSDTTTNTNTTQNSNAAMNSNNTLKTNAATNVNSSANANSITNINSATNTNSSVDTSNWHTYTNETYGYSIKYPESCAYSESTTSGGLFLTNWSGCGMDVFVDRLNNKTIQEWAIERNYNIIDTYATTQLTFTVASFTGEMAGTRSLALIPHGSYMFRIDINDNDIERLEAILSTMTFTE